MEKKNRNEKCVKFILKKGAFLLRIEICLTQIQFSVWSNSRTLTRPTSCSFRCGLEKINQCQSSVSPLWRNTFRNRQPFSYAVGSNEHFVSEYEGIWLHWLPGKKKCGLKKFQRQQHNLRCVPPIRGNPNPLARMQETRRKCLVNLWCVRSQIIGHPTSGEKDDYR